MSAPPLPGDERLSGDIHVTGDGGRGEFRIAGRDRIGDLSNSRLATRPSGAKSKSSPPRQVSRGRPAPTSARC